MQYQFSDKVKNITGSATREIFKLLVRPEIISFAGGLPATECLPKEDIAAITAEILSSNEAIGALQYGSTEGFKIYLEQVINFVLGTGVKVDSFDNILTLSGGQQGIDLMSKAFLNKGDTVLVEDPTYLAALQIFATYEANIVGIKSNKDGLDLDDLTQKIKKHKPKFLYVVPTFSNPTGKTYSEEIRRGIAKITLENNVMVLEDDPYSKLRFSGKEINALKTFEVADNIVYITSFSKILAPGLRIGAAIGNKDVIRKMAIGKQGADVSSAHLSQLITAKYLSKGLLVPNIEKSIPIYKQRKDAMIAAIEKHMPSEYKYENPDGGLFVWGKLDAKIDVATLLPKAVEKNVAFIQGTVFYAGGKNENTLRLNYSNASIDKIETGIKALSEVFKQELTRK
ncbi:MAG: PLP-dependent aminotransferase family protein [Firmicutes bacterium]|nr:PLP-dependent aminotransferase family protein [Bacillota bacterium]